MTIPKLLRRKTFYIGLVAILIIGGAIVRARSKGTAITYETATAERRDLVQTVEATGEMKPADRIDLSFKNSGTVRAMNVKIGDKVTAGQLLAELKNDTLVFALRNAQASLAIAAANLNARLAGETPQSIHVAETQVQQAQAAYDKAVSDLEGAKRTTENSIAVSELAVQTAKNNLDNQDAIASQTVQNSYDSARTTLATALGPLQSSLTDGDQIIGVDNTTANSSYASNLGILDSSTVFQAKNAYLVAKTSKQKADQAVNMLTLSSSKDTIVAAGDALLAAVTDAQTYLSEVQKVLGATLPAPGLTAADLTAKKSAIDADRSSLSSQRSAVLAALQGVKNSELTRTQTIAGLKDAHSTAQTNLQSVKADATTKVRSAETVVASQKAALDGAKASLDLKKAGPRAVDVASLRASVQQAQVSVSKAQSDLQDIQITAPVDGTIADILPSLGEQMAPNVTAIKMVGIGSYDIEAQIPEADIAKIHVGQSASVTLDSFGDEVKFNGTVTAEEPDQTKIQDAVYYKIRVQIDPAGHDVKPGMTANVTITTDEQKNVIVIPLRAIRTDDAGVKHIRILNAGVPRDQIVEIGLKGDEGRVEITKGVSEGEQIIVSDTSNTTKP